MDSKRITIVHTGYGDTGKTKVNKKIYSKNSDIIKFLGMLDCCQSLCTYIDVQDFFFIIGGIINNPSKVEYYNELNSLYDKFKKFIETKSSELEPLTGFIRTTENNTLDMQLRAKIRETECFYYDIDYDEFGFIEGFNLGKYLNLLSDYIFVHVWFNSISKNDLFVWTGVNKK